MGVEGDVAGRFGRLGGTWEVRGERRGGFGGGGGHYEVGEGEDEVFSTWGNHMGLDSELTDRSPELHCCFLGLPHDPVIQRLVHGEQLAVDR